VETGKGKGRGEAEKNSGKTPPKGQKKKAPKCPQQRGKRGEGDVENPQAKKKSLVKPTEKQNFGTGRWEKEAEIPTGGKSISKEDKS